MAHNKLGFTEGLGANIASHSFTEDGHVKHMERIAPGAGVLQAVPAFVLASTTGQIGGISVNTAGKGRIIVMAKAETGSTDFFSFRLIYKDASGAVIGLSKLMQPTFCEYTELNLRFAVPTVVANDVCASSVEIFLVSLPVNLSVHLSAIAV